MSASASPNTAPVTLANALLPGPVRRILESVHALAAQQLTTPIKLSATEFERELFKVASQARSSQSQSEYLAVMRKVREGSDRFAECFMACIESQLATLRQPPEEPVADDDPGILRFRTLTLVEDTDIDRDIVLREISRREASRSRTALQLLAQRFGVLAGTPAFTDEQLPLGPYALCQAVRCAGETLDIDLESQLLLYRIFERQVMEPYGELTERLNILLAHEGVLPGLVYRPYRSRLSQPPQPPRENVKDGPVLADDSQRPLTQWYAQSGRSGWSAALAELVGPPAAANHVAPTGPSAPAPDGESPATLEQNAFAMLQGMLSQQRAHASGTPAAALASPDGRLSSVVQNGNTSAAGDIRTAANAAAAPIGAVLETLGTLQAQPIAAFAPGQPRRSLNELRGTLLEHLRKEHGADSQLSQEHSDTFDLLGLLYGEVEREVRRDAPAAELLVRLQVPVVRAALQDHAFFVHDQHPARELLNSVAESGATWLSDEDTDPHLILKLRSAVEHVVGEYDGNNAVFEDANREVQGHYREMARKAEVAERRQVEAARGRDRLEIAKRLAGDAIQAHLKGRDTHKFSLALLTQAWTDVLTLTLLRQGEHSREWRERKQITQRITDIVCAETPQPPDPELAVQVESALAQVGYHRDEAAEIARRLSASDSDDDTNGSRTELAAKLKARARLGQTAKPPKRAPPPRSAAEEGCYAQLRALPFGSWFEFVLNQQGDVKRQRLSWFSPITDNALFVNQRGQKVNEQSLDSLARLMAQGQVRIVSEDGGRLIDRAWQAALRTLRNLAGGKRENAE